MEVRQGELEDVAIALACDLLEHRLGHVGMVDLQDLVDADVWAVRWDPMDPRVQAVHDLVTFDDEGASIACDLSPLETLGRCVGDFVVPPTELTQEEVATLPVALVAKTDLGVWFEVGFLGYLDVDPSTLEDSPGWYLFPSVDDADALDALIRRHFGDRIDTAARTLKHAFGWTETEVQSSE